VQPELHVVADTWIDCAVETVSVVVADPASWPKWWPRMDLTVIRDRGVKGIRWAVTGRYHGTAEIWLEPFGGGVILHHFLRLDPSGPLSRRATARLARELAWHARLMFWELKDELERPAR
jgi:hypothetical protein